MALPRSCGGSVLVTDMTPGVPCTPDLGGLKIDRWLTGCRPALPARPVRGATHGPPPLIEGRGGLGLYALPAYRWRTRAKAHQAMV